ncbi:MAG TPA: hypothetical protein VII42_06215 [Caulobacteraceae bacterium]
MKRLLLAAALAPLSFAAAAHAQTTISTATTAPLATSSSGDITITSAGSITPATNATSGTVAVTLNSNNSVDNEGAISVSESTTGDGTNQGIANGPFANGSDRFGILVTGGGPFTGNITVGSTGTITIIGENSAAIAVDSALNGSINDAGGITVTGGNANTTDVTYGIFSATGAPISGSVSVAGAITATGANATGVALNGDVGGNVTLDSAITVTGYRSTTPASTEAGQATLTADQLLQSGPDVSIGGNVAGGITLQAATAASGNITANAGGTLTEIGSAPALLIGGAAPITVGAAANGYSVTIGGAVSAAGTYFGFNGEGIQIGGVNGLPVASGGTDAGGNFSTVTLPGGLDISGSVQVTAVANSTGFGGVATGVEIGAGATVPRVTVSGSVVAIGSNGQPASGPAPGDVTAIKVDNGASVGATSLNNSGTITAEVDGVAGIPGATQDAGGIVGNATAISDAGGGLSAITNTGNITAIVLPAVKTDVAVGSSVAIFANNTDALTITQCVAEDSGGNCTPTGNATLSPSIQGDIVLTGGTGAQTLNLWGGNITGAIGFGNNTGNVFDIENGGIAKGALTEAPGGALALNVNKGELFMTSPSVVQLSTLHVGGSGELIFTGDPNNTSATGFNVAGTATLDDGAAVGLALTAPLTSTETFTVITAGNLTAGNISSVLLGQIPFLENGNITTTSTTLSITASPKSAGQLGFNPAEAALFPAFSKALGSDAAVSADILSKLDRGSFIHAYDQFLPDYSGGVFETLVAGEQAISRAAAEAPVKLQSDSVRGWVQEIGYANDEQTTKVVNGYDGLGFGIAGGIERARGDTALGVTAAFLTTGVQDDTQPTDQALSASSFQVGVYWRKGGGQNGLNANASLNGGLLTLGSHRFFIDETNANDLAGTPSEIVAREAKASWLGAIMSANIGVGYQVSAGRFFIRPEVSGDYVLVSQAAYKERGGGSAFNLDVASQTSGQADAQADVVMGANFGQSIVWRPELTVGYRAVVYGGPAKTVANFQGGQTFTLDPQFTDKGGFLARVGLRASGQYADFSAGGGGEFRNDYQTYDARASARFLF